MEQKLKKKVLALAALALFSATGTAIAAGNGFYILGSIGQSEIDLNGGKFDKWLKGNGATGFKSSLDDSDTAYKLQVGYQINEYFAVEGGYIDFGNFGYSAKYNEGKYNINAKVDGWNVTGLGIWPINQNFSVFGKLGLVYTTAKSNVQYDFDDIDARLDYRLRKTRPLLGVGAAYHLTPQAAVRVEFEHINKIDDVDGVDAELFSIGFSYKF